MAGRGHEGRVEYQLTEAGIETVDGLEIQYSLSWCQGDGACFTGTFKHAGFYAHIKHTGQYYHSRSVDFEFEKTLGEEDTVGDDKALSAFIDLYRGICTKLENYGYSILEYRMTDEEFADCCDSNEYEFHEDGRMY